MNRFIIAVFAITTLSAVGCGKGGSSDPVAKMKGYRDQMCACAKTKIIKVAPVLQVVPAGVKGILPPGLLLPAFILYSSPV